MRIAIHAALAGVAALLLSLPAAANGRFPQSNQYAFSPSDNNLIILRTSYGILTSHDNGGTWAFVCEDALGISTVSTLVDPPIGLTQNNSLLVGVLEGVGFTPLGLDVSTDVGCNWNCVGPLAGQNVVDLTVRPNAPASAVAVMSTYDSPDANVFSFNNQVFETTDNGATWSPIGTTIDQTVQVTAIEVAKTDPNRLYVAGTRGYGSFQKAVLFVSVNKGQAWIEGDLSSAQYDPSMEMSIFIGGVDPTNDGRLYLRSQGQYTGGLSRLTTVTVGSDGTPSFKTTDVFQVSGLEHGSPRLAGELLGFALSADGSKVYVGTEEDGLWVAQTSDMNFTKNSSLSVQCLATRGSELWACGPAVDGFIAGVSTDDGKTFTPKLPAIGDLTGAIACAPNPKGAACGQTANSSQCGAALNTFCETEPCDISDAAPAAPHGGGSTSSSCSCNLAAVRGGGAALAAGFAIAGIALRRRRKRR
jgi:hypothetical protein